MQLFVLFPSLMRAPMWLRRDFTDIKTARVEVRTHARVRVWRKHVCVCVCMRVGFILYARTHAPFPPRPFRAPPFRALFPPLPWERRRVTQVDWEFSSRENIYLALVRRAKQAAASGLNVWRCKRLYGSGARFTLFGPEGTAEVTDRPYVVAMQ